MTFALGLWPQGVFLRLFLRCALQMFWRIELKGNGLEFLGNLTLPDVGSVELPRHLGPYDHCPAKVLPP